jgi:hypothetical protein
VLGDTGGTAQALRGAGELALAKSFFEESLAISQALTNDAGRA